MASAEIVTIGTEILLGQLIDTNSVHIAHALADHGVDVYAKHSVGDNAERLAAMLEDVLARADGAITTGGLGPTVDDLTKDAVARAVAQEAGAARTVAARDRGALQVLRAPDDRQQPPPSVPARRLRRAGQSARHGARFHRAARRRQVRRVHARRAARDEADARRAADPVAGAAVRAARRDLHQDAAHGRHRRVGARRAASKTCSARSRTPRSRCSRTASASTSRSWRKPRAASSRKR